MSLRSRTRLTRPGAAGYGARGRDAGVEVVAVRDGGGARRTHLVHIAETADSAEPADPAAALLDRIDGPVYAELFSLWSHWSEPDGLSEHVAKSTKPTTTLLASIPRSPGHNPQL